MKAVFLLQVGDATYAKMTDESAGELHRKLNEGDKRITLPIGSVEYTFDIIGTKPIEQATGLEIRIEFTEGQVPENDSDREIARMLLGSDMNWQKRPNAQAQAKK